jgi:hypothetical protein
MLRITVHDRPPVLTFQIEGRLAGPSLRVVEKCWRDTLAGRRRPTLRVDLTGVTFIDGGGEACLTDMHRQGAELMTADCLTSDIVAGIIQRARADRGGLNGSGEELP